MKGTTKTLFCIATLALHLAALAPGQDEGKQEEAGDLAALQGTWQMVSGERKGRPMPDAAKISLRVEEDQATLMRDGQAVFQGKLTLDSSKSPATIDLELAEDAQGEKKGQISQGIYALEDGEFKWCNAEPGVEDRPAEFATGAEANYLLLVFKRAEEPEE